MVFSVQKSYHQLMEHSHNDLFSVVLADFDSTHQHVFQRAKDNDLGVWFSVTLVESSNFNLSAQEFCDAPAIRYHKPLPK